MHGRLRNWVDAWEIAKETKSAAGMDEMSYGMAKSEYLKQGKNMPVVNTNIW